MHQRVLSGVRVELLDRLAIRAVAEPVRRRACVRALDRVLLRHGTDRLAACGRTRAPRPERLALAPALEGDLHGRAIGLHDSRQHGLARPGEHAAQRGEELRDVHSDRADRDLPVDGHRLCRHRVRVAAQDRHGGAVQVAKVDEARRERGLLRILDRVGQFLRHGPSRLAFWSVSTTSMSAMDVRPRFREAPEQASEPDEQEQHGEGQRQDQDPAQHGAQGVEHRAHDLAGLAFGGFALGHELPDHALAPDLATDLALRLGGDRLVDRRRLGPLPVVPERLGLHQRGRGACVGVRAGGIDGPFRTPGERDHQEAVLDRIELGDLGVQEPCGGGAVAAVAERVRGVEGLQRHHQVLGVSAIGGVRCLETSQHRVRADEIAPLLTGRDVFTELLVRLRRRHRRGRCKRYDAQSGEHPTAVRHA